MTATKARKGDLILVEQITRNFWSLDTRTEAQAAGRELPEVETSYTFGVVASATKDGQVKTWYAVGWGEDLVSVCHQPIGYGRRWVVSTKDIDVESALRLAKEHHWPGHPGQPRSFATFDEAKHAVAPAARPAVRPR
jgi:hypothetical protein